MIKRPINLSTYNLADHVNVAIDTARKIAGGEPLNAIHLTKSLRVAPNSQSNSFTKIQQMFADIPRERVEGVHVPVMEFQSLEAEDTLDRSVDIARKYIDSNRTILGRDLITIVLLTTDKNFSDWLATYGINIEKVRDEWYQFVVTEAGQRGKDEWKSWWKDAGVDVPFQGAKNKTNLHVNSLNRPSSVVNQATNTGNFDELIRAIITGNDDKRADIVEDIRINDNINRSALSSRLRQEIDLASQGMSSPSMVYWSASDIPSIRSWLMSCLIWTDVDEAENREFLLRHVDEKSEPDENVRYWVLAGLYQRKVSFLNDAAIRAGDNTSSMIRWLSRIILEPLDIELQQTFATTLIENYDLSFSVLRVLRVVPMVSLADDILKSLFRSELNDPIAYDIFCTMINPEMAKAIADAQKANGYEVKTIVLKLLYSLQNASLKKLTPVLLAFDGIEVDSALESFRSDSRIGMLTGRTIDLLNTLRRKDSDYSFLKAGFKPDTIDVANDMLDITRDVKTLAAVILAIDVTPPLAIGLFGDWGHGKSFFMNSIKKEIKDARKNKYNPETFCLDNVQIEFNAWHYVDTNLWASLVSHILSQLSNFVSPQATFEERQKAFLTELNSTKEIVIETQEQQRVAKEEIEKKQDELRKLQIEREQKKIELKELRPEDLYQVLPEEQKLRLKGYLKQLGMPSAVKELNDLDNVIKETATTSGRITSLIFSFLQSKYVWIILGLMVLVLGLIPLLLDWIETNSFISTAFRKTAELVAKVAAVTATVSVSLKKALTLVNSSIGEIEKIKNEAEKLLANKRSTPSAAEQNLQKDIDILNSKETEMLLVLSTATKRVAELEERIRLLNEERSLNRFLVERTHSDDYRKHLGIISTIRQDFESLTQRMADAHQLAKDKTKFQKVDRIILYIDDLDRCPTHKVMEVLQAVHLLLAYPLFVVIVGVDPRWLLHSLGSSFSIFQQNGAENQKGGSWATTPQNFLEKIFQIQFSLKPMSATGYNKLVENLLASSRPATETTKSEQNLSDVDVMQVQSAALTNTNTEGEKIAREIHEPVNSVNENLKQKKEPPIVQQAASFTVYEEALLIKDWEIKFAQELFEFLPSPRAVKRFTNVYRLLKAAISKKDLRNYEGSAEIPGDFQVPMLLLALATGLSPEAVRFFPDLLESLSNGRDIKTCISDLISKTDDKDQEYGDILKHIQNVVNRNNFPNDNQLFLEWLPRVVRFSFDLSRVLK